MSFSCVPFVGIDAEAKPLSQDPGTLLVDLAARYPGSALMRGRPGRRCRGGGPGSRVSRDAEESICVGALTGAMQPRPFAVGGWGPGLWEPTWSETRPTSSGSSSPARDSEALCPGLACLCRALCCCRPLRGKQRRDRPSPVSTTQGRGVGKEDGCAGRQAGRQTGRQAGLAWLGRAACQTRRPKSRVL